MTTAHTRIRPRAVAACLVAVAVLLLSGVAALAAETSVAVTIPQAVQDRVLRGGAGRVIVELRLSSGQHVAEGQLASPAAVSFQRQDISAAQARVIARLQRAAHKVIHRFETVPFLALEIGATALVELQAAPQDVLRVTEDVLHAPLLPQSVPLIEADQVWARGSDGGGFAVAVLDTGIDKNHPFLSGKVLAEACFAMDSTGAGRCPNGLSAQIGDGAAAPCSYSTSCTHGTHVAGIAAGSGISVPVDFSGVARGANLVAVQVFQPTTSCGGGASPCPRASTTDIMRALEQMYLWRATYNIAAVNLSLGAGQFFANCDAEPSKASIDNLRSVGIATVVSAGNDGWTGALSSPACVSSAISVGSTTKADAVSFFSNNASFLSLLAPGGTGDGLPGHDILSSVPGTGFADKAGTSMAAPHVAGAWALLKQAKPNASVDDILAALQRTGRPITDTRNGFNLTKSRIRVAAALNDLNKLELTGLTADRPSPQGPGTTITFTATAAGGTAPYQFKWFVWNGVAWALAQNWSTNSTFAWTPTAVNANYRIEVWARSAGSTVDLPEGFPTNTLSYRDISFAIAHASITSLVADHSSPQPPGTAIVFTATAAAGTAPHQFKWFVWNGTAWTVGQNWSTSASFPWTPTANANYRFEVWVRSAGSTADLPDGYPANTGAYRGTSFTIETPLLSIQSVTADHSSPQPPGTTIVFTATATAGVAPHQFKWFLWNGVAWTLAQNWSTSNTFSWTPMVAYANYQLEVWVRSAGSIADLPDGFPANARAYQDVPFAITVPVATITSLVADRAAPQGPGTTITFTATASSAGTPEFKWFIWNGAAWNLAQNWSTSTTLRWTPTVTNANYQIEVWVRTLGNPLDLPDGYPANTLGYRDLSFAILPAILTGLTADRNAPQPTGTTITFTATATAGTAPYQYKWFLWNGAAWTVPQNWSTSNTFVWTPTVANPNYRIELWVRSAGSTADLPDGYPTNTGAYRGMAFAIQAPSAQVRFLNDLLICNPSCASFTARLTASQGYVWLSTSGTYSPYQAVTTPTLSNFIAEAIGYGVTVGFPGSFPLTFGRRYALVLTVDGSGSPILGLVDEGAVGAAVPPAGVEASMLRGRRDDASGIELMPAGKGPRFR